MKPSKIVTHGGTFHADELCAIAIIFETIGEIPIERVFQVQEEDQFNPSVWVLDIGREYDSGLGNFDHHHDADIPATNVLVLRALSSPITHPENFMLRERIAGHVEKNLFNYVSDVDTGKIIETGGLVPTLPSIIRAFNNVPDGFHVALKIMRQVVAAYIAQALAVIEGEDLWDATEKRNGFAIHDSESFIVGWEQLAQAAGMKFLVKKNQRGGWEVISRDSSQFNIPANETQTFRHNSGFMAVYATKEAAVAHVTQLCTEKTQAQKFEADWGCHFDEGTMPYSRTEMEAKMSAAFEQEEIGLPVWGKDEPLLPEGATMTEFQWEGNSATFQIIFADGSVLDCTFSD